MKYIGELQITDELRLLNPEMRIEQVIYNWLDNKAMIDVAFNENGGLFRHIRLFEFDIEDRDYTTQDIMKLISNHEVLGQLV